MQYRVSTACTTQFIFDLINTFSPFDIAFHHFTKVNCQVFRTCLYVLLGLHSTLTSIYYDTYYCINNSTVKCFNKIEPISKNCKHKVKQ